MVCPKNECGQFVDICMAYHTYQTLLGIIRHLHLIYIIEKEIVLKYGADFLKQCCVYAFLLENLVDIGAITMQHVGKPCHGSSLSA